MPENQSLNVLFDGSFDGFLSVIHAHYYEKLNPAYISERSSFQQTVDSSYVTVETDYIKSEKVFDALHLKISPSSASTAYYAFLHFDDHRFINIYKYILLGFSAGEAVDQYMKYDYVLYVQKASKYVGREAHLLCGFCRFSETKHGVLYARIGPNNNVLALLANHFADRLMNEQWIIHDEKRNIAAVYDGSEFVISPVPDSVNAPDSETEASYKNLWHTFYNTIAIENRVNPKLQRNNLPLRYRKYMTEFKMRSGGD